MVRMGHGGGVEAGTQSCETVHQGRACKMQVGVFHDEENLFGAVGQKNVNPRGQWGDHLYGDRQYSQQVRGGAEPYPSITGYPW